MNLAVELCGVKLKNPVIAASGTFGFGREYDEYYDISRLGGISLKALTSRPRMGNRPARIAETASGMLNAVGLQNPGVREFIRDELPRLEGRDVCLIANVAGESEEDYCRSVQRLSSTGIHMIELNISCPNVMEGGRVFGADPESVSRITAAVREVCSRPLIVKLSPNVADIAECAAAAEEAGADAVSLINTITGMAINARTRRPVLKNVTGGLSGPAIKPVALRMVYQAAKAVKIPVIGMGGIMTGEDVAEFMLAGASAVQVGTANLVDPFACPRIIDELERFMRANGIDDVNELTGGLIV